MPKITGNEPASFVLEQGYDNLGCQIWRTEPGLTIRQQFAMMAMQGLLANTNSDNSFIARIVNDSVDMADSLIKALNETPNPNESEVSNV